MLGGGPRTLRASLSFVPKTDVVGHAGRLLKWSPLEIRVLVACYPNEGAVQGDDPVVGVAGAVHEIGKDAAVVLRNDTVLNAHFRGKGGNTVTLRPTTKKRSQKNCTSWVFNA